MAGGENNLQPEHWAKPVPLASFHIVVSTYQRATHETNVETNGVQKVKRFGSLNSKRRTCEMVDGD